MSDEDLSSVLTDLATELAATFPSGDRGDAAALLQDCLLPWELRNYHGHPRPDTLKALVTENLRSVLDAAAPDDRLDTLRHRVRLARSQALEGEAMQLALQRYGLDNPQVRSAVRNRLPTATPVAGHRQLAERLAVVASQLDDVEYAEAQQLGRAPEDGPPLEAILQRARRTIDIARTGSFDLVDGPLAAELRMLGAKPAEIDLH